MPTETAEERQHQDSLFEDPLSKYYAAVDAFEEESKMVKEKESEYPEELQELVDSAKDLSKQVKERKEEWLESKKEDDEEYAEMLVRKAEAKIQMDEFASDLKVLAKEQVKETGELDLMIIIKVDGVDTPVRLQTMAQLEVALDGKTL